MPKKVGFKGKTVEKSVNGKLEVKKQINPKPFEEDPASVNYRLGATLNMGSYESMKVEVGITLPCKAVWPEIRKTYIEIRQEVEKLMDKEVTQIKKVRG